MDYETMNIADFDDYDVALVQVRADGSALVRINKLNSTGVIYEHKNAAKALADARIRVAEQTNELRKVCVHLDEGAVWSNEDGSLVPPRASALISKPIR